MLMEAEVTSIETTDPISELVIDVPLRDELVALKNDIENCYTSLAEGLYQAHNNAHYLDWGFETFKDYCEEELGIKYRRVQYMVQIASTVKKLGIAWDDIREIGWTKARNLVPMLNMENSGRTIKEWLDFAAGTTVLGLEAEVKEVKAQAKSISGALEGGEAKASETKYSLYLNEEQLSIVTNAIESAKSMFDVMKDTEALENICYQWAADNGGETVKASLEETMAYTERAYGVILQVVEQEDIADLI